MATDAEIRARGINFLSPQRYLQNPYQLPTEEEETAPVQGGITNTNSFTNSGGNGGGGGTQTLNPYYNSTSRSAPINSSAFRDPLNQKIMDQIRNQGMTYGGKHVPYSNRTYENQLNKYTDAEFMEANPDMFDIKTNRGFYQNTVDNLKNFGGKVVDKFSGLPGVEKGKGFIRNIMDNTMVGRFAAMRNPLNPNASNYNKNLQGQLDYLSGLSVNGKMMIGRDPDSGLGKYGPDSILSGQNTVSGFGTNDYGKQLQNYHDKYSKTMSDERLKQLNDEIKALEEEEDINYSITQKGLANKIREQIKNKTIDPGFNIHTDPTPGAPPIGGNNGGGGDGTFGTGSDGQKSYSSPGDTFGTNATTGGPVSNKTGRGRTDYMKGGRTGYFFGGRVNFKDGGLTSIL